MDKFVDSKEALRLLGIKPASLYSYVSRGLIRRVRSQGAGESRYALADIERQIARRGARRGHRATAGASLLWGEPVLETSLSSIGSDGPCYRGIPFQTLASAGGEGVFERTAEFLWTGHLPSAKVFWQAPRSTRWSCTNLHKRVQLHLLTLLEEEDGPTLDSSLALARRIISTIASEGKGAEGKRSVSEILAKGWKVPEAKELIDRALVVCAEHELNSSTFAARIIASTNASLVQSLIGAVGAHSGPKHGGASIQFEKLLQKAHGISSTRKLLKRAVNGNELLAGFGHPLYPHGDPRATFLFNLIKESSPKRFDSLQTVKFCTIAEAEYGLKPNIDAGLVALQEGSNAPKGSASEIFLIGRLAGWIAHILEQRNRQTLLRPRALYRA